MTTLFSAALATGENGNLIEVRQNKSKNLGRTSDQAAASPTAASLPLS